MRVLLLEAGGWDYDPMLRVPLGVGRIWGYARYDWGYATEPEPNADGRRIEIARGKVIGGSSSINAMGYIRGHRGDYDRWASYGLPGWSFREVLPYFKRAETWEDGESELRGGSGPLHVRRTRTIDPLYEAYMAAGQRAGHPFTDDYNGVEQHGFGWAQWTIRNGRRGSTSAIYLRPALRRRNLTVRARAQVTRVLIENGRAVGVEYVRERTAQRGAGAAGGPAQRRRDQFAAAADALGHRRSDSNLRSSASSRWRRSPASAAICRTTTRPCSRMSARSRGRSCASPAPTG